MRCPETCEISGLVALRDYTTAARAGVQVDSLGPLLALSLVAAGDGMSGDAIIGAVRDMADAMRMVSPRDCVGEFLVGAARGFGRSGDGQALADTIELANVATMRLTARPTPGLN